VAGGSGWMTGDDEVLFPVAERAPSTCQQELPRVHEGRPGLRSGLRPSSPEYSVSMSICPRQQYASVYRFSMLLVAGTIFVHDSIWHSDSAGRFAPACPCPVTLAHIRTTRARGGNLERTALITARRRARQCRKADAAGWHWSHQSRRRRLASCHGERHPQVEGCSVAGARHILEVARLTARHDGTAHCVGNIRPPCTAAGD
jgi:hypothetical protein